MAFKKSLGLVLSGGGYRGAAHTGVLQALEENKIKPAYISGTSAGAIVGALYASGCSVSQILKFWEEENLFQFSYFTFAKPGLVDTDKMTKSLKSTEITVLKVYPFLLGYNRLSNDISDY